MISLSAQEHTITPLLINGNPENTYNLVIVAEAYKQNQLNHFITQAKEVENVLALNPVYKSLLDKMNIYAISTPSVDGQISLIANNPSTDDPIQTSQLRDTYFYINFENSYRAYTLPDSTIIKARRVAAEHIPFADVVLILVNCSQEIDLSGRATTHENVAVAGVINYYPNPTFWEKYLLIHELGHNIGGLQDEYSEYLVEGFNTTGNNDKNTIRWKDLLSHQEVGIHNRNTGVYIPNMNCVMNGTDYTYFGPVCANRITNVVATPKAKKIPGVHRLHYLKEDLKNNIFQLGWEAIPGATHYEVTFKFVDFKTNPETEIDTSMTTTTNEITFDLPGSSSPNFSHRIGIRAYNLDFSTDFFHYDVPYKHYTPAVFEVPTSIQVSNETSSSFKLEWDSHENSKASLIRLWNAEGVFSEILTDKREIVLHNLVPGQKYEVQVAAVAPLDVAMNNSSLFSARIPVSTVISTQEYHNINKLTVYPNPVENRLKIIAKEELVNYEIYDLLGQKLTPRIEFPKNNILSMGELKKGIYFIKVQMKNKRFETIKFLKK